MTGDELALDQYVEQLRRAEQLEHERNLLLEENALLLSQLREYQWDSYLCNVVRGYIEGVDDIEEELRK